MKKILDGIFFRLVTNFKDPIRRRNVGFRMLGKLIGVAAVLFAIWQLTPSILYADDTPIPQANVINAVNTVWTLVAAFLVFCMQVGFEMLEAGFARSREAINIVVEGIADTAICGVLFWAWGFAFMFEPGTPWIGTTGFFLSGLPDTYGTTGVPLLAFWVFQFAFADTCSTITSGAMVGRTGFIGDLLYSVGVTGFIYPIIGHWAWGPDGWLAVLQPLAFRDFAGSTVVHTIGGAVSLAGAVVLGPRLGRVFKRDGGGPMPPHDIILGALGGLILWFGWYGFNPGSTLSAMDTIGIGRVSFNTTLAACSAGLTALFFSYIRTKKWDLGLSVNGFLAGLVAITCPCYWVDPFGAFFIGIGGGLVVVWGMDLLEYFRIDDPIGAVPVHMLAGIWGTLSLGLFATGKFGVPTPTGVDTSSVVTGLFYHGGMGQLVAQAIGSGAITLATLVVSFLLMYAVNLTGTLRVSEAGEMQGLDLHEHGMTAYPEFVTSAPPRYTSPKNVK
ncbi:MAG: ammonium transporter [Bacteroidota bacterium]|nr:ammonium transporter [Bacteroidota bacterium]